MVNPTTASVFEQPIDDEEDMEDNDEDGDVTHKYPLGTRVSKYFEGHGKFKFKGYVHRFNGIYYRIHYTDGDLEDMSEKEVQQFMVADPTPPRKKKRKLNGTECGKESVNDQKLPAKVTPESRKGPNLPVPLVRTDMSARDSKSLWKIQGMEEKDASWGLKTLPKPLQKRSRQIAEFFLFMYERQCMWVRKNRSDAVCSANEMMRTKHFCNVYRELDRGTAFFHAHILELRESKPVWDRDEWTVAVLWASYGYRQTNRIESFMKAGFPEMHKLGTFVRGMHEVKAKASNGGLAFFSNAHQTTSFSSFESALQEVAANGGMKLTAIARYIANSPSLKDMQRKLETLPLVGPFFGWQMICDLQESGCIDLDPSFCKLGPGAAGGLDLIFPDRGEYTPLQLSHVLVTHQADVYRSLGLQFPYWEDKMLTLKEVEHALCEFKKFKDSGTASMRRMKSRADLDQDKLCQTCSENCSKGQLCDTCFLFFCNDCVPPASELSTSWLCQRCTSFSSQFTTSLK